MPATVSAWSAGSWRQHEALREANRIKACRRELRVEARNVGRQEGMAAGRAVVAAALVECPEWLARADVMDVLVMAPGVAAGAARLYALTGARKQHRVAELSARQRRVLADGLRALGGRQG